MDTDPKDTPGQGIEESSIDSRMQALDLHSGPEDLSNDKSSTSFLEAAVRRIESIYLQRKLLSRLKSATPGDIYTQLDKARKQIRLLSIAAAPNRSDDLKGELKIVSLDDSPNFIALSYVWGDAKQVSTIELCSDGYAKNIPLGHNLDGVLRALRQLRGPITIWCDALCINQKDTTEKSFQVPLMASIYSDALRVMAFLDDGEEEFTKKSAIDFMKAVIKHPAHHFSPDHSPSLPRDLMDFDLVVKIQFFLQASWWRRIWTAQEAILAKDLILIENGRRINFSKLLGFSIIFSHHFTTCCANFKILKGMLIEDHILRLLNNLNSFAAFVSERDLDFFDAVASFRHRQATNPSDKIYGVVGLSKTPVDFVDYNVSTTACYTTFVLKSIEKTGKLNIFAHLYNLEDREQSTMRTWSKDVTGLPSWVPDWSLDFKVAAQHEFQARAEFASFYSASKKTRTVMHYTSPGFLWLKGLVFDEVAAIGEINDDTRVFIAPRIVMSWAKLAQVPIFQDLKGVDEGDEDVKFKTNMFRTTLSCGMLPDPSRSESILRGMGQSLADRRDNNTSPEVLFQAWYCLRLDEDVRTMVSEAPDSTLSADVVNRLLQVKVLPYWNLVSQVTQGRRFILTKNGNMGFAPKETAVGDSICILCGGNTPYIFRPGSPHNTLLGDSYIYGTMNGQVLDFKLARRDPLQSPYYWIRFR